MEFDPVTSESSSNPPSATIVASSKNSVAGTKTNHTKGNIYIVVIRTAFEMLPALAIFAAFTFI